MSDEFLMVAAIIWAKAKYIIIAASLVGAFIAGRYTA